jgi:Ca2+-transporting ATPase
MMQPATSAWHALSAEKVMLQTGASPCGLSIEEAARRLQKHGPNQLGEARPGSIREILLNQFRSVLVWLLLAAGVISGVLREWVDALAITGIVLLNAVIGFYQEFTAEKSIAALKKMTAPQARVRRNGHLLSLPAAEIVPGDVLEVETGDIVAADARLFEAASLKCVESALTGESEAVDKHSTTLEDENVPLGDRKNIIFMGTSVVAGVGRAVVVASGMSTELGRIAHLMEEAATPEATPLQQKLHAFGRLLVWAAIGIVVMLFLFGLLRGIPLFELFMSSISLAVAAVPEGLPAVVTVALALAVRRMARLRALVRRLPVVETLGSATVICTDKTGTLTVGQMTVRSAYIGGHTYDLTGEGYAPTGEVLFHGKAADSRQRLALRELATVLTGSNNSQLRQDSGEWIVIGDPTEGAMLAAACKMGVTPKELGQTHPKIHEFPFDSDRKRRTTIRRIPDENARAFVNGAPDVLLDLCTHIYAAEGTRPITNEDRERIRHHNAAMARRGLRVLGSAYRHIQEHDLTNASVTAIERNLVFVGLVGMQDPPRAEAKAAVARCRAAGIQVAMITGDHPETAFAIAKELGITASHESVVTGLQLDAISDDELRRRAPKVSIYARVTAAHKLRIVRAWKANGAVVAMTGDGVNDAPAIKGAHIGIAMGRTGTEVTKQASDMIITDDNFATIVGAVEQGRGSYDNIRKTLSYLLAGNCGELLLMTAAILIGLPLPLLAIHLLWINLITDGLPALALATDPIDSDVMNRPPRLPQTPLADRPFLMRMLITGFFSGGTAFAVYLYALHYFSVETARTWAFTVLVFAEMYRSFGSRSETKPLWRIPFFSNPQLLIVSGITIALQFGALSGGFLTRALKTTPVSPQEFALLLSVAAIPAISLEFVKFALRRNADDYIVNRIR